MNTVEAKERRKAVRLGRSLCLRSIEKIKARYDADDDCQKDITQAIRDGDFDTARSLLESGRLLTNMDLASFSRDLQDRFGQPKRSEAEVNVIGAPPVVVQIPESLWEGDDAPRADAGGDDARDSVAH